MVHYKSLIIFILLIIVYSQSSAEGVWTTYYAPDSGDLITTVTTDGEKIWYGSDQELFCLNKKYNSITSVGYVSSRINDIAVDHDGVVWLATYEGVSSYDGTGWKSFPRDDYFMNNNVYSVCVDAANRKWFAAGSAVVCFDSGKWIVYREPYDKKIMKIMSVGVDSSGVIWFGSEHNGIASYDDSTWNYYDDFENLYSQTFVTITEDINKIMWFGTSNGTLFSFDGVTWNTLRIVTANYQRLYDITADTKGRIWAATNQGLTAIDNGTIRIYEHDGFVFNSSVRAISFDTDGILWVGGYKGISEFEGDRFTRTTIRQGPLYDMIISITIGPDNVKWFGHGEKGISRYDGVYWTAHVFEYATVGQIAIDHDNVVWCTAGGDGAVSFDGSITKNYYTNLGWESINAPMTEVMVDDDNKKWFTGYRIYSNGTTSYTVTIVDDKIDKYYYSPIYFFRSPDNTIWAKRWGEELGYCVDYLSEGGWIHYVPIDFKCTKIAIDKTNTLWFVSYGDIYSSEVKGLNNILKVYDGTVWTTYSKLTGRVYSDLAGDYIYSLAVDRNNVTWVGTNAGVSRFDGNSWTTFNSYETHLCHNKINAIAVEKDNTIWFGTDVGISKYTGEIIPVTSVNEKDTKPVTIPILKIYPNPFNLSTTIEFTMPEAGFAAVSLYNMAGQKVRELASGRMTSGTHRLQWDGKDESGSSVSAGVYIARLKAGGATATAKLVLVK